MIDQKWLDRFGYVRTKQIYQDSGNGVYYSTIATCLGLIDQDDILLFLTESSMLKRNLLNSYGNTSHDDYLAIMVLSLRDMQSFIPRAILLTTILNLGYLKNCPYDFKDNTWIEKLKQIAKPLLLIYPAWWVTMIASAFPNRVVFWSTRNLLLALISLQRVKLNDASGTQLRWLVLYAIKLMGTDRPMRAYLMRLQKMGTSMSKIMIDHGYWSPDHPVLDGYDKFTKEMIGV